MNYVFFDLFGNIRSYQFNSIYQYSDLADSLYVFSDFTKEEVTPIIASIFFVRSDGMKIGGIRLLQRVYVMNPETNEYEHCFKYDFTKDVLGINGPLQISVLFQTLKKESKVLCTKANAMLEVEVLPVHVFCEENNEVTWRNRFIELENEMNRLRSNDDFSHALNIISKANLDYLSNPGYFIVDNTNGMSQGLPKGAPMIIHLFIKKEERGIIQYFDTESNLYFRYFQENGHYGNWQMRKH